MGIQWDFHVFYHWEREFLNASGNGKNFLKIATEISRYFVNGTSVVLKLLDLFSLSNCTALNKLSF